MTLKLSTVITVNVINGFYFPFFSNVTSISKLNMIIFLKKTQNLKTVNTVIYRYLTLTVILINFLEF